jgi:glyoxylase-like metal-dependent hydrolase (beta-lactamase superfamily II)
MAVADDLIWVSPSLLFWQAYDARCRVDLSSCAHIVDGQICLVDPIELSPGAIEELSLVAPPKMIVLTNGNHARAALQFKERFKIPIFAHHDAREDLEIALDGFVDENARVFHDCHIIPLTGAGPGEIAIYQAGSGVLSIGDALINLPGSGFCPLPKKYCEDSKELTKSLGKLASIRVRAITFAHGLPIVSEAGERLLQVINTKV